MVKLWRSWAGIVGYEIGQLTEKSDEWLTGKNKKNVEDGLTVGRGLKHKTASVACAETVFL